MQPILVSNRSRLSGDKSLRLILSLTGTSKNIVALNFVPLSEIAHQLLLHIRSAKKWLLVGITNDEVEKLKVWLSHLLRHRYAIKSAHHYISNLYPYHCASSCIAFYSCDHKRIGVGFIPCRIIGLCTGDRGTENCQCGKGRARMYPHNAPYPETCHSDCCHIVLKSATDHRAERISAEGPPLGRATAGWRRPKRTRFTNFSREAGPHDGP